MSGTVMVLWIALLRLAIDPVLEEASCGHQAWWRELNLSSPMYSSDGSFLAFKAGFLRDDILERRLLIINVAKWRPVYQVLIQRRKLPDANIPPWRAPWQELFKEYYRYGFTWLGSDRLVYFDFEGKLFTLDLKCSPPRKEQIWNAEHIYRVVASHQGQYLAVICKIKESAGIVCVIIDTKSKSVIYKHATSMEADPYPVAVFSNDDKWLAVSDGELIDVINLEQRQSLKEINLQDDVAVALKFAPMPNILLAMTEGGSVYFCDLKSGSVTVTANLADAGEFAGMEVIIVEGRRLLLAWNENDLTLFDLDKLKLCWTKPLQNFGCALCPNQRTILVVAANRQLLRLSLSAGESADKGQPASGGEENLSRFRAVLR